jgi:hypothetical protein
VFVKMTHVYVSFEAFMTLKILASLPQHYTASQPRAPRLQCVCVCNFQWSCVPGMFTSTCQKVETKYPIKFDKDKHHRPTIQASRLLYKLESCSKQERNLKCDDVSCLMYLVTVNGTSEC